MTISLHKLTFGNLEIADAHLRPCERSMMELCSENIYDFYFVN